MNEPQGYYTKRSQKKTNTIQLHLYVESTNKTNEQTSRNRFIHTKNKLVVARMEEDGDMGKIGKRD